MPKSSAICVIFITLKLDLNKNHMIHTAVVLTEHHRLLSLAAILDVFETANPICCSEGNLPFFGIVLVGKNTEMLCMSILKKFTGLTHKAYRDKFTGRKELSA